MKEKLISWLNLLLVANVFLVIAGFVWLIVAAVGDACEIPLGLDLWHELWQPLFNPAISLLIGGAVLSATISSVRRKFPGNHFTKGNIKK
ncbi:hypothetical protein RINTHH_1720 [Richelia intracellularis HH01]|jgi:hypothetical protein|uniref:Uncharacterized protein n=1 Tax=Richelia intracellularis HH01 TaxID=1165094 RepID=M1WXH0_9NOST|nr:hypothetical protein [Richelia intracellularis]CCH66327.1 hypothetical protein RINTHH_1720 [Richelia intracellularis HH01]HAE05508.1 hypothetical protein [Richelia sp.]